MFSSILASVYSKDAANNVQVDTTTDRDADRDGDIDSAIGDSSI